MVYIIPAVSLRKSWGKKVQYNHLGQRILHFFSPPYTVFLRSIPVGLFPFSSSTLVSACLSVSVRIIWGSRICLVLFLSSTPSRFLSRSFIPSSNYVGFFLLLLFLWLLFSHSFVSFYTHLCVRHPGRRPFGEKSYSVICDPVAAKLVPLPVAIRMPTSWSVFLKRLSRFKFIAFE